MSLAEAISHQIDPDDFIERAHQVNVRYMGKAGEANGRNARIVFILSRFTTDPIPLACGWLNGLSDFRPMDHTSIVTNEFGFITAAMYQLAESWKMDDLRDPTRDRKGQWDLHSLCAAIVMEDVRTQSVGLRDPSHVFVAARKVLELLRFIPAELRAMLEQDLEKAESYRKEILGQPPADTPILSIGHPSTLGVWKMLCKMTWGADCVQCQFFDQQIEESPLGISTPVRVAENALLGMLHQLSTTPDVGISLQVH